MNLSTVIINNMNYTKTVMYEFEYSNYDNINYNRTVMYEYEYSNYKQYKLH